MNDMSKVEGGSSKGVGSTPFQQRLEPVPAGGPSFTPPPPETSADENGTLYAVREHGGRQGRGGRGAGTGVSGVPGGEHQGPGMSRRRFLGLAAATTVVATEVALETAGVGPISLLRRFFGGRSPNPGGESALPSATPKKTEDATATAKATATATKEPTVAPEVLPFEIGSENTYGNVSLIVAKSVQEKTLYEYKALNGVSVTVNAVPIGEIKINEEKFPSGSERLNEFAEYIEWQNWVSKDRASRVNITFEEFEEARNNHLTSVEGQLLEKKTKISFALVAEPTGQFQFESKVQYGLYNTSQRRILATFNPTIGSREIGTSPVTAMEAQILTSGLVYGQDKLGKGPRFLDYGQEVADMQREGAELTKKFPELIDPEFFIVSSQLTH